MSLEQSIERLKLSKSTPCPWEHDVYKDRQLPRVFYNADIHAVAWQYIEDLDKPKYTPTLTGLEYQRNGSLMSVLNTMQQWLETNIGKDLTEFREHNKVVLVKRLMALTTDASLLDCKQAIEHKFKDYLIGYNENGARTTVSTRVGSGSLQTGDQLTIGQTVGIPTV